MSKCMCPPCTNSVVNGMKMKLTRVQADMIGYFCARCILNKCDSEHKTNDNRKQLRNGARAKL